MNNIISRDVWKKLNNPVIITKEEWNLNKDEVLFKNQLKQMLALTEDSSENNDIFEKNNVVAVVGERGSGKTSVLKSYKNIVESDKNYVFDIINPDLFDSEISILITYVTELYKVLEKDSFKFSKDHLYPKTVNGLLEIIKLLSDIQKKTKYFDIEHPSVDILDDIDNRLKFTSRLKELTNDVLQIMNLEGKSYKKFILIIDDIDLSESHIVFILFDEI